MKHPFYPGIEFDPVEDDEGQEYKDNFFDMDKPVRWGVDTPRSRRQDPGLDKDSEDRFAENS